MTFPIEAAPIPLVTDADGVVRVGNTRVTFDTVVGAFQDGATAEEIVQQYPVLDLADIYSVIGYYLHRRTAVEAYLQERRQAAKVNRRQDEASSDHQGVRQRLLARRTA